MSIVIIKNSFFSVCLSCLIGLTFMFVSSSFSTQTVQAQSEANKTKPARKTKRVQAVSAANAKKFQKIVKLFDEKQDAQAKQLIDQLSLNPKLNNFEKAYLSNFLGAYYYERNQLDKALQEYKKILANPKGISTGFLSQITYTIAQVYFSKGDYKSALDYAQRWFKATEAPSADAYMLLAQTYYALKQFDKALPYAKIGIQKYIDDGGTPKESWLNLLSNIYSKRNDYRNMLPVLKQLVQYYPRKVHLSRLANIYNELQQTDKMAAIYLSLYDQGLLTTKSEIKNLGSLLLSQDNPYKAAKVFGEALSAGLIEKDFKNYGLYAQSLFLAKEYEKVLLPLGEAAKLSDDGKLYYQLGQSYVALYRWGEAEKAFANALKKGKLKRAGNVLINLGLAQFELKKFEAARKTFKKALKHEKSIKAANRFIKYLDSEVVRLEELKKPVNIEIDIKV